MLCLRMGTFCARVGAYHCHKTPSYTSSLVGNIFGTSKISSPFLQETTVISNTRGLTTVDGDLSLMWSEKFGKKPDSLQGKVVWIVGASGGIGEHLAYKLADAGCRLILSARREQELQRVSKECLERPEMKEGDILVLPMDSLELHTHQEKFQDILKQFGQVDILVLNAGRSQRGRVVDTPFEIERQIMELNYFSAVSVTKTVLPHMIERRQGHIVVLSSITGKFALPLATSYSATKHALQGWFNGLRSETAEDNIDITLVCPGPIVSDVQRAAFTTKVGEEYGVQPDGSDNRMRTDRCAQLISVAMANRLPEAWISKQPTLRALYLYQYMPSIALWATRKFGAKAIFGVQHSQKGGSE